MTDSLLDVVVGRPEILSLIDFLSEYQALRQPPVYDIERYGLYTLTPESLPDADGVDLNPSANSWLRVGFLEYPARPELPADLRELLGSADGLSARARPTVRRPEVVDDEIVFDALARRAVAWIDSSWSAWSARYLDVDKVKVCYQALFEARQRLGSDRESVELVWGFGRLRWNAAEDRVNLPLLVIPVEIELEDDHSLSVHPEGAVQLDMGSLAGLEVYERIGLNTLSQSLEDQVLDPWAPEILDVLRRAVRCFDHNGVVEGEGDSAGGAPVIDNQWVLYMRRRRHDYQGFLDQLRDLYTSGVEPTAPFGSLVSAFPTTLVGEDAQSAPEPVRLLLPLHANDEQRLILTSAQKRAGVTVQGPPGTGKSHTIANLISHFVAHGQRVLVVAEKEQALTVLADKLPAEIRDLTVSVLGADAEGRRGLEASIKAIQSGVARVDRNFADQEMIRLENDIDGIDRKIAEATDRLLKSRLLEATPIDGLWEAGPTLSPSVAGAWISGTRTELGYIPDPIPVDTVCPMSGTQFARMLELINTIGIERAEQSGYLLPDVTRLPDARALVANLAEVDELAGSLRSAGPELHDYNKLDTGPDAVQPLLESLKSELKVVRAIGEGWLAEVAKAVVDPLLREEWEGFVTKVGAQREQILTQRGATRAHDISLPTDVDPRFSEYLRRARELFVEKGRLGRFGGDVKKAVEACRVDGHVPCNAAEVELCLTVHTLDYQRQALAVHWRNQTSALGGPPLSASEIEVDVRAHLELLDGCLQTRARQDALWAGLGAIGITPQSAFEEQTVERLIEVCELAQLRPSHVRACARLEELNAYLAGGAIEPEASPVWKLLASALQDGRSQSWDAHHAHMVSLAEVAPLAQELRQLRDALRAHAPNWTAEILADPAAAGSPHDLLRAWEWRRLRTAVDRVANSEDPSTLQKLLEGLTKERLRRVTELVSTSAWRRLLDNLGDEQSQALRAYLTAVTRYGKTGGKYKATWLSAMRAALDGSKEAVPVWIMPTRRALESFRPTAVPPFDVLIVDEASQIGIDALPLLSLAKRAIVVGDDKQTTPETVGLDQEKVQTLLQTHLSKVPHYQTLFMAGASLYDIALQKYPNPIMLKEHFRCLPDIIEFSSRWSYNNDIIALRDKAPSLNWKPLGAVKVTNGYRQGNSKTNLPEAEVVAELVASMCYSPEYQGMDFGVVSLLGSEQSKLIWDLLFKRLGPDQMEQRRIRCSEAAGFQGDERDVMVISTVVATDPLAPEKNVRAQNQLNDERRVNVAASRAKNQMWVVHSVDPERIGVGDRRAELIRHCRNPRAIDTLAQNLEEKCNEFERLVLRRILARGYKAVRAQHEVGRFRIDLVVEGPASRLAVECDGEEFHGPDRWHADRTREQILERSGWLFERIRGSKFFTDPDAAMEPLWARLDDLGIPVGDEWLDSSDESTVISVSSPSEVAGLLGLTRAPETAYVTPTPVSPPRASSAPLPEVRLDVGPEAPTESPPGAASVRILSGMVLAPYAMWPVRLLPDPKTGPKAEVQRGLVEIVAAEGPMHILKAIQTYVQGAGGAKAGKVIKAALMEQILRSLATGALRQIDDEVSNPLEKTLYVPGTPPVVVREMGKRGGLGEVPRSEIQQLIKNLGLIDSSPSSMHRVVLTRYGIVRLTTGAETHLEECRRYRWSAE